MGVCNKGFAQVYRVAIYARRLCIATILCLPPGAFAQTYTDYDGVFDINWSVVRNYNGGIFAHVQVKQISPGTITIGTYYTISGRTAAITRPNGTYVFNIESCYTFYSPPVCHVDKTKTYIVSIPTAPPANPPATFTVPATDSDGAYNISWSTVTGAETYEIQERVNGGSWSTLRNTPGTAVYFSNSGGADGPAKGNGSYGYQIRACNQSGCSGYSAVQTTDVAIAPGLPGYHPTITLGVDGTSISSVSWSAASGSTTNYQVQRRLNGGSWSIVHTSSALTAGPFTGLGAGAHEHQVRACKTVGAYTNCSAWSQSFTGVVPGASNGVPNDADAFAASERSQYLDTDGEFTLSWAASGSPQYYKVTQYGVASSSYQVAGTSRSFSALADGLYTFTVSSCSVINTQSGPQESCTAIIAMLQVLVRKIPPATPATFTVPATDSDGTYNISWSSVSGAMTYEIQERVNGGAWSTLLNTSGTLVLFGDASYMNGPAKVSGSYGYQVRACNDIGCSAFSAILTTDVVITPGMPNGLGATLGGDGASITVHWNAASGSVTHYELQRRINGVWGPNPVYSGAALTVPFTGLSVGAYEYRVRSCTTVGSYTNCSAWSQSFTGYVPGVSGGAPVDSDAYTLGNSIQYIDFDGVFTLNWPTITIQVESWSFQAEYYKGLGDPVYGLSKSYTGLGNGLYSYTVQGCAVTTLPSNPTSTEYCSSNTLSAQVLVQKMAPQPIIDGISADACAGSVSLDWSPGAGYPAGATIYYDLEESIDNGITWKRRVTDTTLSAWSRSAAESTVYQYRVSSRYWNGYYSQPSSLAESSSITMPPCTSETIPQPPEMPSDPIGSIQGSFGATPSGAASYGVTLQTPPGIGGMAPKMSLDYNSQGGNGFVGTGWSLGGLSAITRCPATLEPEGFVDGVDFDGNDRFCLDGKKLILVPGTGAYGAANSEYRTEIDGFSNITAVGSVGGGPSSFIVRARTGEEMLYGARGDSSIEAQGKSAVMTWALTTITDSTGNKMEFYYNEYASNTEYVPSRVEYAFANGVSNAKVEFSYGTQSSPTLYFAGSIARNTRLLQTVTTYASGLAVKEYRLQYETGPGSMKPRLKQLTECSLVSGTVCLKPTVFSWYGLKAAASIQNFGSLNSDDNVAFNGSAQWPIDVDGDGAQELIYLRNNSEPHDYFYIKRGSSAAVHWGFRSPGVSEGFHHWPMDINGDGLTDLVFMRNGGPEYWVMLNKGDGTTSIKLWGTRSQQRAAYKGKAWPMDVNGDGRMDLVYNKANEDVLLTPTRSYYALIAQDNASASDSYLGERNVTEVGLEGNHWVMDINSDGLSDLVYVQAGTRNYHALINNNGTLTPQLWVTRSYDASYDYANWPFDANGDGLLDLVYSRNGFSEYRVLLNKGDGTAFEDHFANRQESPGWNGAHWTIDVNADGVQDLVYNKHDTDDYYAMVSQPDGSRLRELWVSKAFDVGFNGMHMQIDSDGDGFTELLVNVHDQKLYKTMGVRSSFDLLRTVTDGYDNVTTISYKQITDATVYDQVENPYNQYPAASAKIPLRVVSKVVVPDGVGGTRGTEYFYKNLKIHRKGRGSLGFAEVISTDTRANMRVETRHIQDFPRTGLVSDSVRCLYTTGACQSNKILQKTVNTYAYDGVDNITIDGPGLADARFIYPSQTVETMYALDNASNTTSVLAIITTTNANPDAYGNIRSITVETDSQVNAQYYKTTTANVYANDTADWHLGLLTASTVTKYLDGGVAMDDNSVRKTTFEYDPGTHLLVKETVEPDRAEPFKRVTAYQRDSYGNIIKATACASSFDSCAPGAAGPSSLPFRTITTVYDSLGQFPQSVTNAEDERENYVYERKFGNKLSLTGPNGLTTNWTYDVFGRPIREIRADGTRTVTAYKWCNGDCPQYGRYYVTTQSTGGAPVTEYFDAQGRKLRTRAIGFGGWVIYTDTVYNDKGQPERVSEPYFEDDTAYWTYSAYDAIGRVTTVTPPLGPVVHTDYDGLTTTMSRIANGVLRTESETKNIIGQTESVTNPAGTVLIYSYDSQGNLATTETEGLTNTRISVTYDLLGRKTRVVDPDMGTWNYQYNGYGDLVSQSNALGQTVTIKYDRLGRLIERNEAEGRTLWVYGSSAAAHNIGKLVSVSGPDGLSSKTIEYDSLGRPSQTITHIDIAPYTVQSYVTGQTYDAAGRVSSVLYPEVNGSRFRVNNRYNSRGYLLKVMSPDASVVYWEAQDMNARGQLEMALLGNGASVQNSYRPETGALDGILVDASDLIYHMSYEIDEVGNIESRTDLRQGLTEHFQYDSLDQLTYSSITGGSASYTAKSYQYDALGNITYKTGVGSYSYGACGAGPHAVCQAGTASYAYNANGSMTSGGGRTVSYTSFNLPYQFIQGGATVTFQYGPDRTRIFKSDGSKYTSYIGMSDTGNALYEHEVQGTTEKHLHFIYAGGQALAVHTVQTGISPQTKTEYLHRDHLGSVEAVSNASGVAVAYFSHDAWGKPRNANWTDSASTSNAPGNLGFTGHEMIPEVGLIHMNGRVYDPLLGKFLSADPNVQFEKDVRSYNRYSYVANNPLRYTDPTGYFLDRLEKWVRKHFLTVLNVVAWFYPALQPYVQALNVMTVAYYANNAQQAAGGLAALLLGGWAGDRAVGLLSKGASEFMQAVVRGGTTGAITGGASAMLMGTKIGRGILQGAVVGAVTAAIAWTVKQSQAESMKRETIGKNPFDTAREAGDVAGAGTPASSDNWPPKNYGSLTVDQRKEVWNKFLEEYDQISKDWNQSNLPGILRLEEDWYKNMKDFLQEVVQQGYNFHDWQSERFAYELGMESLEAFREFPPSGHWRPSKFGKWSTVNWELYDFGGSIKQTMDFHYWVNGKGDMRPADCYLTGSCRYE